MELQVDPKTIGHENGALALVKERESQWFGYGKPFCSHEHVYVHPGGIWEEHAYWFDSELAVLKALVKAMQRSRVHA